MKKKRCSHSKFLNYKTKALCSIPSFFQLYQMEISGPCLFWNFLKSSIFNISQLIYKMDIYYSLFFMIVFGFFYYHFITILLPFIIIERINIDNNIFITAFKVTSFTNKLFGVFWSISSYHYLSYTMVT